MPKKFRSGRGRRRRSRRNSPLPKPTSTSTGLALPNKAGQSTGGRAARRVSGAAARPIGPGQLRGSELRLRHGIGSGSRDRSGASSLRCASRLPAQFTVGIQPADGHADDVTCERHRRRRRTPGRGTASAGGRPSALADQHEPVARPDQPRNRAFSIPPRPIRSPLITPGRDRRSTSTVGPPPRTSARRARAGSRACGRGPRTRPAARPCSRRSGGSPGRAERWRSSISISNRCGLSSADAVVVGHALGQVERVGSRMRDPATA